MKALFSSVLFSLLFVANSFSQDVTLIFPYNDEELTDIACSFKAEITSDGPYLLQLCRDEDFSGTIITHHPNEDRWSGETKDEHDFVYFLSYQGKLVSDSTWILDPGVWYWRITGDGGASYSETRKLTVNDIESVTPLSHEISPREPLFHLRLGGRPIEYASDPGAALGQIIPDNLKENMVLDLGHSFYQFHLGQDLFEYSKTYNDLGYKFSVDLGLASTLGRIVSPGEVEKIYRDLPNFVGGEIAEMFYKYWAFEADNSQLYAMLELSRKYGKFFLFGDMNWKYNKWQLFNYEFYDIFEENNYNDYFLPVFKTTDPLGYYTCISSLQGMKLTGMVNNIGIWSDMWTWEKFGQVDQIVLDDWLETGHSSGEEDIFPYIQNIKQFVYGMSFGATVFMVEPELQWDWAANPNDLYYRYLYPFMGAVVNQHMIPSVEAVNKNYHVLVDTEFTSADAGDSEYISYLDGNIWGDFLRNTFGIADISGYNGTVYPNFGPVKRSAYLEMLPNTDRYPSGIPFLPKPGVPAPMVDGEQLEVVGISEMRTKQGVNANLNQFYPESDNIAFATIVDSSIFVFNTLENHDIKQHYDLNIQFAGIDSLYGDIDLMSYIMGRKRSDGKSIFFQTNGYVATPTLTGGKYDLPTYPSILNFKCQSEPILESSKMSAITKTWDEGTGILSLEINHKILGAVNFILTGDSAVSYAVDSVSIEKQGIDILVHENAFLTGHVFPDTLQGVYITWQSLNPAVASISQQGILTGTGDGTCKIIALAGGHTDTLEVRVTEIVATAMELDTKELFLDIDESETLTVSFTPSDASFKEMQWKVQNSYASVDKFGKVTGQRDGITRVIATHLATGFADTCKVYVGTGVNISLNSDDQIRIFPNPATDKLYVSGAQEGSSYSIITLSGRTLTNSRELPLELNGFSQGVYFLKIESDDEVFYKKLLIGH